MSDFHLKTELPEEDKVERMAEAFEVGLRHCATDPLIRLKMIMGETIAEWNTMISSLADKLRKESGEVVALAMKAGNDESILRHSIPNHPDIASTQQLLLEEALDLLTKPE